MISPTDLFHPSPGSHFKTFQVFLIYCPKRPSFSTIYSYAPNFTSFFLNSKSNVLVKRVLYLLNEALAIVILHWISQVHLPSFVKMLPKYLKDSYILVCNNTTFHWSLFSGFEAHIVRQTWECDLTLRLPLPTAQRMALSGLVWGGWEKSELYTEFWTLILYGGDLIRHGGSRDDNFKMYFNP